MKSDSFLGIKLHQRIRTGQTHTPWSSVFMVSLIWFTWGFHVFAGGQALQFMVKEYSEDVRIISIVMTLNVIIMLSPFISYISDQIWTRAGRRRPFLLIGWAAGCFAMFSFAFLPQMVGFLNGMMGAVGLPKMGAFALLIGIIVSYTTLYDLVAPLEPLFLEAVPPHQRGRFFAIRGILFSLAIAVFYQILWPIYDDHVSIFGWAGHPDLLRLRGQQMIFIFGGSLFFITGAFMLFGIEETKVPTAPNKRFRDLGIGRFLKSYVKDVFLARENYPYYIVLVIPTMETMVWGGFGAFMQNDQFGYSKANQALWAFPIQIISMAILTPFSGWYSDANRRFPKILRYVIFVVAFSFLVGAVFMYRTWAPPEIRELPPFWVISVITLLVAMGSGGVFVVIVESMLDRTGRDHTRAWVSLLTVIVHFAVTMALFISIQSHKDKVIPITLWMCFNVSSGTFGALLGTFVGPMIYEYMPRNKMGTINSGRGVYNDILKFLIANLGATWVWFYATYIYHPPQAKYDYSAMYILQFVLFVPALIAKIYFLRQVTSGRLRKWGIIEVEGAAAAAKEEEKEKAAVVKP